MVNLDRRKKEMIHIKL